MHIVFSFHNGFYISPTRYCVALSIFVSLRKLILFMKLFIILDDYKVQSNNIIILVPVKKLNINL